jgi:hypothetical protein
MWHDHRTAWQAFNHHAAWWIVTIMVVALIQLVAVFNVRLAIITAPIVTAPGVGRNLGNTQAQAEQDCQHTG